MPVLIDRGVDGCSIYASPKRHHAMLDLRECRGEWIRIGLVNNMPDAAIEATEQQFVSLLDAASGERFVYLQIFSLPGIPRTQRGRDLTQHHFKISDLWNAELDGLIVTGTEPRAKNLVDEPYWQAFAQLVDWAERHTISTVWSCLASHAAVLHLDQIVRTPLEKKCFGVFDCDVVMDHSITANLSTKLCIPHARFNDLQEGALAASGYRVLTRSVEAGVDMFMRDRRNLFVFLQGHPEYDATSLLNEYRRDIGRFLRQEQNLYPRMPRRYFDEPTTELMTGFRKRAHLERCEALLAEFPSASAEKILTRPWFRSAVSIYRNWISFMSVRTKPHIRPAIGSRTIAVGAAADIPLP